jgi:hypothetical protein
MLTVEQKLLFDVVHDFVKTSQLDAMRSSACCKALVYFSKNLTSREFDALKARLSDQQPA